MFNITLLKSRIEKNRLLKDSFWAIFGNILGKGLAFIAGVIIANLLGKDIFGQYGLVRNTLISFSMFSTFGVGYVVISKISKLISEKQYKISLIYQKTAIRISIYFSVFLAIVFYIFSEMILSSLFEDFKGKQLLYLFPLLLILNSLTTTQQGILSGERKFKEIARINTLYGGVIFFTSLIFTYLFGLLGALFALLLSQVFLFYCYRIKSGYRIRASILFIKNLNEKKILIKFLSSALPVAMREGVYAISIWGRNLLIVLWFSFGDLGLYSAAMQINIMILYIPGILQNVFLSYLSGGNDKKLFNKLLLFNFLVTIIPVILVVLFRNELSIIYGESFNGLKELLLYSILITVLSSLANLYSQYFLSLGKNWIIFKISLVRDFIIIGLFYWFHEFFNQIYSGAFLMVWAQLIGLLLFVLCSQVIKVKYEKNSLEYQ
ncbi:oligosaccharide flippase family protein [Echinicola rosea]|uniref:Polysaccharide biosynthesis protein n=1 Tax=Echinicola rosea TaxID=1807691 RepID=A0ABQ1UZK2_9BACT|nr:oligosaccharide flippase family protein [Echinicola rosea]GGF31865.1 hypothetical protein GCM10011339_20100 [Echinicola rosea]